MERLEWTEVVERDRGSQRGQRAVARGQRAVEGTEGRIGNRQRAVERKEDLRRDKES